MLAMLALTPFRTRWILLAVIAALGPAGAQTPWRDQGVIHTQSSPHAKLRSIPVRAVRVGEGFWGTRLRVNVETSIPTIYQLIEEHGYVDNFRRISKGKQVPKKGPVFADTDTYKWLEAVAFVLQSEDRPALRATAEQAIAEVLAIQEPSGYLNAHFVGDLAKQRLLPETMEWGHELYNLGHFLQAAVAWYRATGDRRLVDAGARFADYLIHDFGPDKKPLLAGHPEVEMALVELYRTTGDRRYLDLAGYILAGDPRLKRRPDRVIYTFSGTPFWERKQLEGHSVRAMYACSGATDYYLETGDKRSWEALERLWQDLTRRKMYITGGVGSRWTGEAFGEAYELPNARSYAETCAAIGNLMWNWRMLAASGEARFTDVLERALYNAIAVGVSLEGTLYCYRNPLEFSGVLEPSWQSATGAIRNRWYDVLCCPPNIQRTLASLPGYFYSTAADGIYVHLYHNSELDWRLEDGTPLRITQKTRYPWDGDVTLTVSPGKAAEFTLYVRIPGWTSAASLEVNGQPAGAPVRPGTYSALRRRWQPGDVVRLRLDVSPRLTVSNPLVKENVGRVAVERGPLVYALERLDQPPQVHSLDDVALELSGTRTAFREEYRKDFLGGVTVLTHPGLTYREPLASEPLYRPFAPPRERPADKIQLRFIPYCVIANRDITPMTVWVRYHGGG